MPISKSAKKSLRKSVKNHKSNNLLREKLRAVIKKYLAQPDTSRIREAEAMLDKAKKKGVLHKNKVARLKSQLVRKTNQEPVKKVVKPKAKRTVKAKMSK